MISEPVVGKNYNSQWSSVPDIAVENGQIYTLWRDSNNTNNSGSDDDIFYRSNLTGTSWEPVQVISEPVVGQNYNTRDSATPGSIVVENGNIYAVWHDNNDTNGAGFDNDIFLRCNLTGNSWEPVKVISEPIKGQDNSKRYSDNPNMAVDRGKCHIVWDTQDDYNNSGTDFDIFYRWIQTPISTMKLIQPYVTPTLGNTSTDFNYSVRYFHPFNQTPTKINLKLNGVNHSMLESDPNDKNYLDEKIYYYKTRLNISSEHTYQFWVTESSNILSTQIFNCPDVFNTKPEIITGNSLTAIEEEYYQNIYEYADIDIANIGQIGFWNFSTNATWLTFNFSTANLSGTPMNSDVGEYWVNISINDTIDNDFTNFTLEVFDVNDPPEINTTDIDITYEDELYEVDYEAYDIDSPLSAQDWSMETNASAWLVLNSETGVINGMPTNNEVGEYWLNVSVNDSEGGTDFTNFTLIVLNVNDPPVIITDDINQISVGKLYEVDYNASDIDSPLENQIWTLNFNATWLEFNTTSGLLYGRPGPIDVGWYSVNVTVVDGDGGSDWHDFKLTVIPGDVQLNKPPRIVTTDVVTAQVNKLYEIDYEATDDRTPKEQLLWSLSTETNASWLNIESKTGLLSGIPKSNDVGWYWVNVSVDDGEQGNDFHKFKLTVYRTPNTPPEIITDDKFFAKTMVPYWVDYEAIDDRTPSEYLLWYLNSNASWLDIDQKTGVLSGLPIIADLGTYWVKVSVSDGEDGWDSHNFTLIVYTISNTTALNQPPNIITTDKLFAEVGIPYNVDYEATDDRTPIKYLQWYLETNASWLSLDPKTGVLSGNPKIEDVGTYLVKISVTDNEDGWDKHQFPLSVIIKEKIINSPPELSDHLLISSNDEDYTDLILTIHYFDADSDVPLFVQLVVDNTTYDMTFKAGHLSNGIYECKISLSEDEHSYYFTASDGFETVETELFSLSGIQKEKPASKGDSGFSGFFISIIVIIVVILLIFIILYRKKVKQKEEIEKEPSSTISTKVSDIPVSVETIPPKPSVTTLSPSSQPPQEPVQAPITTPPTIAPSVIPTTSQPDQSQAIEQPPQQQKPEVNNEKIVPEGTNED